MQASQVARSIKPYVLRWIEGTQFVAPNHYDYIVDVENDVCRAMNGRTGVVQFSGVNHAAIMQAAIQAAGVNGTLAFRPGTYWLGEPLVPLARQSWYCPFGAVFRPTGDNRILQAVDMDWFCLYGTLHIEDTDRNTTSAEAIYLDGVNGCYFEDIMVWDYHRGMTFAGYTRRSFENVFNSVRLNVMRHQGLTIWAEVGDNYFNNLFLKGPSTVEWASGQGLVIGLYPVQGTIFGGIMFGRVEVLDFNVNVDLQGLFECWFDQILSDNALWAGIYIGDHVQRLFVGTVWAAGCGDGVWIQGSANSFAQRLRFNQIFSWINAQYGVHFNGWVKDVHIGALYLLENQIAQLRFSRGHNINVSIDSLTIEDSNRAAIDAGGIDDIADNVSITHAQIDGGECMGLDLLRRIDGIRDGKFFESRGVAYIPAAESWVDVPHELEGRPTWIQLTPMHYGARQAFVSYLDHENFLIDAGAPVGTQVRVSWAARSGVEVGGELLANPNVDSGNGGTPDNWLALGTGATWDDSDAHNGTHSLRINGNFATWRADPFAAVPFGRYRIRAYVKGTGNPFAELAIRFFSDSSATTLIDEQAVSLTSAMDYVNQYVRVQADFSAPDNTQVADLVFRNTASDTTDVYGDAFSFGLPSGANLLANPSVEDGAATPDHWLLDGATWESGVAHTGSRSLRLTHAVFQKQARADWVAVTPGASYEAVAWLQGSAGGNVALAVMWYSDMGGIGNLIRSDIRYFAGDFATWTQVNAVFNAPASAQSAYFIFRMAGWVDYDLLGDAFSARQLI